MSGAAAREPAVLARRPGAFGRAPAELARDQGVLVLGGPTATGKSELAAALAQTVGGAVVGADSRQVHRGLEIGSAQPDPGLCERAPHFLFGFLSPVAPYSAGRYGEDARRVTAALRARGLPVVLCGGTGLYLRAALGGLFREELAGPAEPGRRSEPPRATGADRPAPAAPGLAPHERQAARAALALRWELEGGTALHAELARIDPVLAARVHPADRQRVLRGLAFHAATGGPLSRAWQQGSARREGFADRETRDRPEPAPGSRAGVGERGIGAGMLRFRLELSTRELDARIHGRLERMLDAGLLDEARALYERYRDEPAAGLNAVGYRELFRHFEGKASLDRAVARIELRTRQYAKRQRTWFRHQDGYVPLPAGEGALGALLAAWRPRLA